MEPCTAGDQHCFPGEQGAQGGVASRATASAGGGPPGGSPQPRADISSLLVKEPEPLEGKTLAAASWMASSEPPGESWSIATTRQSTLPAKRGGVSSPPTTRTL